MTTLVLAVLAVLSALVTCALLAAAGLAYWIAIGEPDVNGDPERDAGLESTADGRRVNDAQHLSWKGRMGNPTTLGKEDLSSAQFIRSTNRVVGGEPEPAWGRSLRP